MPAGMPDPACRHAMACQPICDARPQHTCKRRGARTFFYSRLFTYSNYTAASGESWRRVRTENRDAIFGILHVRGCHDGLRRAHEQPLSADMSELLVPSMTPIHLKI